MTEMEIKESGLSRRTVIKGAAWSLPVVAVAAATPAMAASVTEVGAYSLDGTCGIAGVLGPGFTITASDDAPLPAGTVIDITGSGVANIGVFTITGGLAAVSVLSATSRQIVLTADLPAGETLAARTTLSLSVDFTLNAVASLPAGYTGTGAKTVGLVESTLVLCSAS